MAISNITLCSRALVELGDKAIGSFDDGTDRASMCATSYPGVKDDILSRYDWKFTIKKRQLARLAETPASKWSYKYALPSDRLTDAPIAVFNTATAGATPITNYEVMFDGLYTDETEVFIDYQKDNTDEDAWPPYFQTLIVEACKAKWAFPVTGDRNLAVELHQAVYGTPAEMGNGGLLATCRARNSRENPTPVFTDFSLIIARQG